MTSAPQPNELGYGVDAALEARNIDPDAATEDERGDHPEFVGDMPEDPEQAKHYRPGEENDQERS
jgi:hypothetical protein